MDILTLYLQSTFQTSAMKLYMAVFWNMITSTTHLNLHYEAQYVKI
jgi:hypothetical protein